MWRWEESQQENQQTRSKSNTPPALSLGKSNFPIPEKIGGLTNILNNPFCIINSLPDYMAYLGLWRHNAFCTSLCFFVNCRKTAGIGCTPTQLQFWQWHFCPQSHTSAPFHLFTLWYKMNLTVVPRQSQMSFFLKIRLNVLTPHSSNISSFTITQTLLFVIQSQYSQALSMAMLRFVPTILSLLICFIVAHASYSLISSTFVSSAGSSILSALPFNIPLILIGFLHHPSVMSVHIFCTLSFATALFASLSPFM